MPSFRRQVNFFWNRAGGARCIIVGPLLGEHCRSPRPRAHGCGSSPRGRGTLALGLGLLEFARVIPAWAGNTRTGSRGPAQRPGHPRVGGEHFVSHIRQHHCHGSSPRGRGTHSPRRHTHRNTRVIPAWAGNTCGFVLQSFSAAGHPRVGGEHGGSRLAAMHAGRVIPAWAGNTQAGRRSGRVAPGHPRVGGEHGPAKRRASPATGSSPRGRGTQPDITSGT